MNEGNKKFNRLCRLETEFKVSKITRHVKIVHETVHEISQKRCHFMQAMEPETSKNQLETAILSVLPFDGMQEVSGSIPLSFSSDPKLAGTYENADSQQV